MFDVVLEITGLALAATGAVLTWGWPALLVVLGAWITLSAVCR